MGRDFALGIAQVCDEPSRRRKLSMHLAHPAVGAYNDAVIRKPAPVMDAPRESRRRRARRPLAYLVIVAVSAVVALGSAWQAARRAGADRFPLGRQALVFRSAPGSMSGHDGARR
jgi:hypothetical protein